MQVNTQEFLSINDFYVNLALLKYLRNIGTIAGQYEFIKASKIHSWLKTKMCSWKNYDKHTDLSPQSFLPCAKIIVYKFPGLIYPSLVSFAKGREVFPEHGGRISSFNIWGMG